jgi:hypothetical protein
MIRPDLMGGTSDSSAWVLIRKKLIVLSYILFFLCGFLLYLFLLYSLIVNDFIFFMSLFISFILFPYASLRYTTLNHWDKRVVSQEERRKHWLSSHPLPSSVLLHAELQHCHLRSIAILIPRLKTWKQNFTVHWSLGICAALRWLPLLVRFSKVLWPCGSVWLPALSWLKAGIGEAL